VPFFFLGVTKIQQFNINLLISKAGPYVWSRTRHRLVGDLFGSTTRGYRHRFCRRSWVLVLTLIFQIKPGAIPFDVIEIIMAVIAAIAAMQVAGGMDYLVSLAERMLRRHPNTLPSLPRW
jgi:anaerobic C4-dicarboxylate transporter DcuA